MIPHNLRHLRLFLGVCETGSLTQAAQIWNLSQPAVTQAMNKLETTCGVALFRRNRLGFEMTRHGEVMQRRLHRAFTAFDGVLNELGPRLKLTMTAAQLQALCAVCEAESFLKAARRQGLAAPTLHRAVSRIEQDARLPLFARLPSGLAATKTCLRLVQAGRVLFYELEQTESELAAVDGREVGRIVIGTMPLARDSILPEALVAFRQQYPHLGVQLVDGGYDGLLTALRHGKVDFLLGALREEWDHDDLRQDLLFEDSLSLLCAPNHPLARKTPSSIAELAAFPWAVPPQGTPTRARFDALFQEAGLAVPASLIETGSLLAIREILCRSLHLGCISREQARLECQYGLLHELAWPGTPRPRPIGLTYRADWVPTPAQAHLRALVRQIAVPIQAP